MSKKVLIIESEQWLGDSYQRSLEAEGFSVARADNAYSAMDDINESLPSVIVTRLLLSGPNGITLMHELQSYDDTANIPVIVCERELDVTLEELEPYGVKRLLNISSMKPNDLAAAIRGVCL